MTLRISYSITTKFSIDIEITCIITFNNCSCYQNRKPIYRDIKLTPYIEYLQLKFPRQNISFETTD